MEQKETKHRARRRKGRRRVMIMMHETRLTHVRMRLK
jgi:hypothetical protein